MAKAKKLGKSFGFIGRCKWEERHVDFYETHWNDPEGESTGRVTFYAVDSSSLPISGAGPKMYELHFKPVNKKHIKALVDRMGVPSTWVGK